MIEIVAEATMDQLCQKITALVEEYVHRREAEIQGECQLFQEEAK